MNYGNVIISLRIIDRKHVSLLSTVYSFEEIDTGRKHWKTKEAAKIQELNHYYKYVGGVNSKDQLMQYSVFSRHTGKWCKKAFFSFHLLNLTTLKSSILYCE